MPTRSEPRCRRRRCCRRRERPPPPPSTLPSPLPPAGLWQPRLVINQALIPLGMHSSQAEAEAAYDAGKMLVRPCIPAVKQPQQTDGLAWRPGAFCLSH